MSNMEGVAGVDSFLLIGQETAYNTEQNTCATHLGIVKSFNSTINNNNNYTRGFVGTTTGGRNVAKIVGGRAEYGASVEMEVINWDWLEYLLGNTSGSGTITYSEADVPPSFTMHYCIDNPGTAATDQDNIWTGVVVESATIKASVGEPLSVSLELKSGGRKLDTTILSPQALPSVDVFNFSGATIELPNGTVLSNIIDSVEITIKNNYNMLFGLGDRRPQAARAQERDYKIKFSVKYLDNDLVTAVLGDATPTATTEATNYASIEFNFVKGSDSAAFLFTTFEFDDYSTKNSNAEVIGEDLSGTAKSLTVTEVQA